MRCGKVNCGRWQIQWGPLGDIASSATKTLTNAAEAAAKISVTGCVRMRMCSDWIPY